MVRQKWLAGQSTLAHFYLITHSFFAVLMQKNYKNYISAVEVGLFNIKFVFNVSHFDAASSSNISRWLILMYMVHQEFVLG
jgi:hypothetical protein